MPRVTLGSSAPGSVNGFRQVDAFLYTRENRTRSPGVRKKSVRWKIDALRSSNKAIVLSQTFIDGDALHLENGPSPHDRWLQHQKFIDHLANDLNLVIDHQIEKDCSPPKVFTLLWSQGNNGLSTLRDGWRRLPVVGFSTISPLSSFKDREKTTTVDHYSIRAAMIEPSKGTRTRPYRYSIRHLIQTNLHHIRWL